MLRLHVLGYTHLCQDGVRVPLSAKALALITFLNLEHRLHHRERLANLFWTTPHALRNLRVELTHIRKLLPQLFPTGQPMLGLHMPTDLEVWKQDARTLTEATLNSWLSVGGGLPLSGLEDVGTKDFQGWVDEQRWELERQVELTLSGACAAFERRGLLDAAKLIRERLAQLGLQYQAEVQVPQIVQAQFERPALRLALQSLLGQARQQPQLIFLRGRSGAGRRELLGQALAHSDWVSKQMQVSPHVEAQRAAFLHQVLPLLTSEPQGEVRMLLTHTSHTLEDELRAWTLLAASDQAVLLAFNDVPDAAEWLMESWQFAMNLSFGLTIVLTGSPLANEDKLNHALGRLDGLRVHTLPVPPLTVQEIMPELHRRQPLLEAEECRAQATLIRQQSAGWAIHARDLLQDPQTPEVGHRRLSGAVRDRLLSDLGELRPIQRQAIMRLAVLHSSIDESLGTLLLGPQANILLADLERLGLLRRCSDTETVNMPALEGRVSDLDSGWRLPSDALRVALAGSLTSTERRELNGLLARHHEDADPRLALYYAGRGGLTDLIDTLQKQLSPPELTLRAARTWEPTAALLFPKESGPSKQHCTSNGYGVALEGGQLMITRAGQYARSPLLRLRWPRVEAGHWHMVLRLDAYGHAPEFGTWPADHALSIKSGDGLCTAYTTDLTPPESPALTWGGPLPLGRWISLQGQGGSGPLELTVRAADLALSIGELSWGGAQLLPSA